MCSQPEHWLQHWSQQLVLEIPVQLVQGQMLLFKTPENWLPTMCMHKVMYLIPRQDGHVFMWFQYASGRF